MSPALLALGRLGGGCWSLHIWHQAVRISLVYEMSCIIDFLSLWSVLSPDFWLVFMRLGFVGIMSVV